MFSSVTITQVQPVNQPICHDSFIADVTMGASDGSTGPILHGLGMIPLEVYITPTLNDTAFPFGTVAVTWDATQVNVTKSNAANTAFNFRLIVKRPSSAGL